MLQVTQSLFRACFYFCSGKIIFPSENCGKKVHMNDCTQYTVFRHMKNKMYRRINNPAVLIVRFKFKRFTHKTNVKLSIIPIPLIAGFPGFIEKLWMIDKQSNYWQGLYQFDSIEAVENYKRSFVLGVMNKRAIHETISYRTLAGVTIKNFLDASTSTSNKTYYQNIT